MNTAKLEELCLQVGDLCRETARYIRSMRGKIEVGLKGKNDLVTQADKGAEERIVKALGKLLPEAGFIAEEGSGEQNSGGLNWVVDPIDGTTNFVQGLPCYSISIALMDEEEILLGVVYEINMNECFYSWKGGKSFMNGQEIQVSAQTELAKAVVATGLSYRDFHLLDDYLLLLKDVMQGTRAVRRFGSAAADLAYVACGRYEGFFELGLSIWDVAAGILIVQNAGGQISDFKGGNNYIAGKAMLATNAAVHQQFLAYTQKHFA